MHRAVIDPGAIDIDGDRVDADPRLADLLVAAALAHRSSLDLQGNVLGGGAAVFLQKSPGKSGAQVHDDERGVVGRRGDIGDVDGAVHRIDGEIVVEGAGDRHRRRQIDHSVKRVRARVPGDDLWRRAAVVEHPDHAFRIAAKSQNRAKTDAVGSDIPAPPLVREGPPAAAGKYFDHVVIGRIELVLADDDPSIGRDRDVAGPGPLPQLGDDFEIGFRGHARSPTPQFNSDPTKAAPTSKLPGGPRWMRGSSPRMTIRAVANARAGAGEALRKCGPVLRYPAKRLLSGKPRGTVWPAWPRLPSHGRRSVSVRVPRPAAHRRPSAILKVVMSASLASR